MKKTLYALSMSLLLLSTVLLAGAFQPDCFGGKVYEIPEECFDNPGIPSIICRINKNSTVDDCVGRFFKATSAISECECNHPNMFDGYVIGVVNEVNKQLVITYYDEFKKDTDGDGKVDVCDNYDNDPNKD